MVDIKKSLILNTWRSRCKNAANSGLVWGTNNYPEEANRAWFGGTTSGLTTEPGLGYSTPSASTVTSDLLTYTRQYARMRRMQIIIYETRTGYNDNTDTVKYNGTAKAHSTSAATVSVATSFTAGASMYWTAVDLHITKLANAMNNAANTLEVRTATVCHDSCHTDCHSSGRNRR